MVHTEPAQKLELLSEPNKSIETGCIACSEMDYTHLKANYFKEQESFSTVSEMESLKTHC